MTYLVNSHLLTIAAHLLVALACGGLIGIERSIHSRPAGFRTHALVCMASSLLMMVTVYQWDWLPDIPMDTIRTDPTRMAQGIMTGIGFLGAGVIVKEGLSIRGLTTSASIWTTAAIGCLFGVGFYTPGIMATVLTILVLSWFRWLEDRLPSIVNARCRICFNLHDGISEDVLREFFETRGFYIRRLSYDVRKDNSIFEYRIALQTTGAKRLSELSSDLVRFDKIKSFSLIPGAE